MEAIRHSFDRTVGARRLQAAQHLRLPVPLLVRARDASGAIHFTETLSVRLPADSLRQRDQLVQAVRDRFPGAHLHRVTEAGAVFTWGRCVVGASYGRPRL